jgi:hypothetical protein
MAKHNEYRISSKVMNLMDNRHGDPRPPRWTKLSDDMVEPLVETLEDLLNESADEMLMANIVASIKLLCQKRGLKIAYAEVSSIVDDIAIELAAK